jgi:membrane fusion protein (multidrug efflux system)
VKAPAKTAATADSADSAAPASPALARKGRRYALMFGLPALALIGAGVWWVMGGRYEKTDDAYVHYARLSIATDVGGRVATVFVTDNQTVKAGDQLFEVDPVPYKLTLEAADAAVANARLGVKQLEEAYRQSQTQQSIAQNDANYYTSERQRAGALAARGISSNTGLDQARHSEQVAIDKLEMAKRSVSQALTALGGTADAPVDDHPAVMTALAARDQAAYNLSRTIITAPADGVVYQASNFRVGQVVSVGQPLFSFVETGDLWVDANFKETQLAHIAAGQKAEVHLDARPDLKLTATVMAIGVGTGSEFSLLPAQNATGNWVKVTQRVPVRLHIDGQSPELQELSSGLSAEVTVDTGFKRSLGDLLPRSLR